MPPLNDKPPSNDGPPYGQEPPNDATPPGALGTMPPPPTISGPLRAALCQVWAVGFLDAMKGEPVTDGDTIPSAMAPPLVQMAEGCVDSAASMIAEIFQENPQTVYGVLYQAGYDVCIAMNAAYGPAEINLN